MILSGEKNSTWRLFDDKDLSEGDEVDLINWNTKEKIGETVLTQVREKKFGEVEEADYDGHEKFANKEEMYQAYRTYYGNEVGPDTLVKIIHFRLKKRIIIVHGWDGSPTGDWIGWATEAFKEKGYEVITPAMPDTSSPVIEKWVTHLKEIVGTVHENTYFIGHSIGCQTIMRFLETIDTKVGGAIFVAGWFDLKNLETKEAEEIARPWIDTSINYEKVKANLAWSVVVLGDNDPWVPYEETKKDFETRLGSEIFTIQGGGHITSDDGFRTFQQLVEIFEKHLLF